jgi:hypothetical protein
MENIIERIAKLLALSSSPNENEASAAAAKAQELLMRYNLKQEDIVKAIDRGAIETLEIYSSSKWTFWKIFLAQDIASSNFCLAWRFGKRLLVSGRKHNVVIVKVFYGYLTQTVERLATNAIKTQKQHYQTYLQQIEGTSIVAQPEPNWRTWRNSFIAGCSGRLRQRLLEQKQQMQRDGIAAFDTSSAVSAIACRTAIENETAALEQWKQSLGITITSSRVKPKGKLRQDGYSAGVKAANDISLSSQISPQSKQETPVKYARDQEIYEPSTTDNRPPFLKAASIMPSG